MIAEDHHLNDESDTIQIHCVQSALQQATAFMRRCEVRFQVEFAQDLLSTKPSNRVAKLRHPVSCTNCSFKSLQNLLQTLTLHSLLSKSKKTVPAYKLNATTQNGSFCWLLLLKNGNEFRFLSIYVSISAIYCKRVYTSKTMPVGAGMDMDTTCYESKNGRCHSWISTFGSKINLRQIIKHLLYIHSRG